MMNCVKLYLELNIVTLIVILIGLLYIKYDLVENKRINNCVRINFLLILVLSVIDTIELWTAEFAKPTIWRVLSSAVGYSIRPLLIYILIFSILRDKRKNLLFFIPEAVNVIVAFSVLFTGIAYSYSENNIFVRGPLGYTSYLVSLIYLILCLYYSNKYIRSDKGFRNILFIVAISAIVVSVLGTVIGLSGRINAVIAIGNMLFYLYFYTSASVEKVVTSTRETEQKNALEKLAYKDVLTELGNRAAFSRQLSISDDAEDAACVVFDVNNLKLCNDRYGHNEGDKMIKDAAECIEGAFKNIGECFRIGGDEFTVLLEGKDESEILKSIERMNVLVSDKNRERIMPLSIAMGYAIREGIGENIEHLFNRSDERMYDMKYRMKKEFPVYCEERIKNYLNVLEILNKSTDDYLFLWNIVIKDEIYFMGNICNNYDLGEGSLARITTEQLESIVYEDDRKIIMDDLTEIMLGTKKIHNLNYRWINRKGEVVWINCRGRVIDDDKGKPFVMIGRVSETEMNLLINPLTGIFNRVKMMKDLKENFISNKSGYFVLIDIDNLGDINIKYGREYGDNLLKNFAKILGTFVQCQNIYHVEHDCFAIYLDVQSEQEVSDLFTQIQNSISGKYTISMGVVQNNRNMFVDENNLFDCAKQTLDKSKKDGKNTISFFSKEDIVRRIADIELYEEMKESVNNDFKGFYLCYQPQVKAGNYDLYAAEALLRYESPKRGKLSPNSFIYILENSHLINKVGLWVLETALLQCKKWRNSIENMRISVNFSTVQLEEPDIVDKVFDMLNKTGMPANSLTIEITESIKLQENYHFKEIFECWKNAGIEMSIDDFGTGYSNMGYLKQLNVDEIKIDRLFINKIDEGTYNYKLIYNMIEFAKMNSIRICCEGVEDMHELAVLEGLSPNILQGFLFNKPCEINDFEKIYINKEAEEYNARMEFVKKIYDYKEKRHIIHFNPKDILRVTDVGLWIIRINEDKQYYEMHADETMENVLGLDKRYTPQECYQFWYDRIKEGYFDYVQKNVKLMIDVDKVVQLEYPWIHPTLGEVVVRCNGRRVEDSDGMIVLEGYHRIISNIEAGI